MTDVHASASTASTRSVSGHQRGRWCGSPTTAQTSSSGTGTVRDRRTVTADPAERRRRLAPARSLAVVGDQRVDVVARQRLAAAEERELDEEGAARDPRA